MKSCLIITARSKSSRYKRKILKNFDNNLKSIDVLIGRAKKIEKPIIVATSKDKSDNQLCEYIKKNHNIPIFFNNIFFRMILRKLEKYKLNLTIIVRN